MTTTPTRRERPAPALTSSVQALPADLASLMPEAVAEASKQHAETLARLEAARAQAREARENIEVAAEEDRAESRRALDAGRAPKRRKAATAEERADGLARLVEAAEAEARQSQSAFLSALHDSHEAISQVLGERLASTRESVLRLTDSLEAELREDRALRHVLKELEPFEEDWRWGRPSFQPELRRRQQAKSPPELEALRALLAD